MVRPTLVLSGGRPPLIRAVDIYFDNIEKVKPLLEAGAVVDEEGNDGETALIVSARHGCAVETVAALLAAGANPNKATISSGETALMSAAAFVDRYSGKMVTDLLAAGAYIDAIASDGKTALAAAASTCNTTSIPILLEAGADVSIVAHAGSTALDNAVANSPLPIEGEDKRLWVILKLMSYGASTTNEVNRIKIKTLGADEVFKVLELNRSLITPKLVSANIKFGCSLIHPDNPNGGYNRGFSLLEIAAINLDEENFHVFRSLIENGANFREKTDRGLSILTEYTAHEKDSRVLLLLIACGAEVGRDEVISAGALEKLDEQEKLLCCIAAAIREDVELQKPINKKFVFDIIFNPINREPLKKNFATLFADKPLEHFVRDKNLSEEKLHCAALFKKIIAEHAAAKEALPHHPSTAIAPAGSGGAASSAAIGGAVKGSR
jgi:hypothetical protein